MYKTENEPADIIRTIFTQRRESILIGLTGQIGSGCSSARDILSADLSTFPEVYPSGQNKGFKNSAERDDYTIRRYAEAHWEPFVTIRVRDLLTSFILENYHEFLEFLEQYNIMGRRTLKSGTSIWVCRKHDQLAANCPNGRIQEDLILNSFIQMYNKLTAHQNDLLLPALEQLRFVQQHGSHESALLGQLHHALAQAAQEQHHISTLVAAGLLDEAVCTQKRTEIHNRIQHLNHQKEALQHNAQLADTIRQLEDLVDFLRTAPSPLQAFDSDLFHKLVQRIEISHSGTIKFLLPGKITLTPKLEEP